MLRGEVVRDNANSPDWCRSKCAGYLYFGLQVPVFELPLVYLVSFLFFTLCFILLTPLLYSIQNWGFYICTNKVANTVLSSILCQLNFAFLFKIVIWQSCVCKSNLFVNRTQRSAIVGIHCTSLTLIPKLRTLNAAKHALVIQQSLVEAPTDWTFTFSRQEVGL